ncbi:radical SAM protein [Dyadobacter sp. CY261]|uniref:radical SAM protein n=1 Tax=Dyadobacter sp. CY261 TaxID=2907203 RepID=UPI001F360514|nr:radical SAM protein [Dyadobacter sp. CY261]MCF0075246.1 radical SAM protein [Dyadobacter sp. CY261]
MAGAIAGTALVDFAPHLTRKLTTITLTINNLCNLSCPHCYLQYKPSKSSNYISQQVMNAVEETSFKHLVIVGKEPLVNSHSQEIVGKIVSANVKRGKTIGLITNGLKLSKLAQSSAADLSYIDVSFDGGKETYHLYRKADFGEVIGNIHAVSRNLPHLQFNALHVVNLSTARHISDMVNVKNYANFNKIMFSPYIETKNDGENTVERLPIRIVLEKFASNPDFMYTENAFILLDIYHLLGESKLFHDEGFNSMNEIKNTVLSLGLEGKVKLIENDPLSHGFLRVTYDGYLLSPYKSLDPSYYRETGNHVSKIEIDEYFRNITFNPSAFIAHAN